MFPPQRHLYHGSLCLNRTWRFEVNPEKSVVVLFPRKRYETVSTIYPQGKPVARKSQVKYLGVVLEKNNIAHYIEWESNPQSSRFVVTELCWTTTAHPVGVVR